MTRHLVLAVPWNREQVRLGAPHVLVVCGCTAPLERVTWFAGRVTCCRCMASPAWWKLWSNELELGDRLEKLQKAP